MTFNCHFTLNFHYYEQHFQRLLYLLTVELFHRIFLSYHVTAADMCDCAAAEADSDPQNISDPRKDCGSFVDDKLLAGATSSEP